MSLEQIKEARRRIANAGGISEMVDGGGCYVSIPGEKAAALPIPELLAEWGDGGRRLTTAGHSSPAATQSVPTFAQALLKKMEQHGIKIDSVFVPWSQSRMKDEKSRSLNWRCTLTVNGRKVMETDYTAGIGHCPSYREWNMKKHGTRMSILHASYVHRECESGKVALGDANGVLGIRDGKPIECDTVSVFGSLMSDGSAIDYPTYEEWARDYGYDEDSRTGEAIYRECLRIGLELRAALGDALLSELRDVWQEAGYNED